MNTSPARGAERRESLADATRRLREALATESPPAQVHAALLAAYGPRAAPVRSGQAAVALRGQPWWAAACAGLLVASTALLLLASPAERAPQALAADAEFQFVPVAPADRWPASSTTPGGTAAWLVAAELPRERLAAWGLPFDPSRAGESVRAELLMRPSGEVLAVRVAHDGGER
ncbi:MAG: hypothetical protein V4792_01290 [Pseudomonadota bacterium]